MNYEKTEYIFSFFWNKEIDGASRMSELSVLKNIGLWTVSLK